MGHLLAQQQPFVFLIVLIGVTIVTDTVSHKDCHLALQLTSIDQTI